MAQLSLLGIKSLALAVLVGVSGGAVTAQEPGDDQAAELSARDRAERVAAYLIDGLPCTATGTADALERRLTESVDPLVDVAAGLDIIAASTDNCAEIRAAAARQRLYIAENALSGTDTAAAPTIDGTWALAFEVGPPPRNLLRQRGGSR